MRVILCALVLCQAMIAFCMIRTGGFMNRLLKVEHVHHDSQTKYVGPKPKWHSNEMLPWRDPLCDENPTTPEPPSTMPEHIDDKQFEVTTPIPYLTLGPIPGIDYHPPLLNISSCERIYIDKFETSDENYDYTAESLEMMQIPQNFLYNFTFTRRNTGPSSAEFAAVPMPMYPMFSPTY